MPNLVGIGNSQVPTNAMLGGLAYQDSVGEIAIDKIKARVSDTAKAIFVYDTRKDSDGGAWRHRTQNLSWYNEGVNERRGARKEFPSVAVIVSEDTPAYKVTIYDGDDPNLSMWMQWIYVTNDPFLDYSTPGSHHLGNYAPHSLSAMNGIICVGTLRTAGALSNLNAGLREFHFIKDECFATNNDKRVKFPTSIADRNVVTTGYKQVSPNAPIVNSNVNDVAMTVLPNAPIDVSTGLPTPTIVIATNGGISVIRDSGVVYDLTTNNETPIVKEIAFLADTRYSFATSANNSRWWVDDIQTADENHNYFYQRTTYDYSSGGQGSVNPLGRVNGTSRGELGEAIFRQASGLSRIRYVDQLLNYTTTNYNTGWFGGDIEGVFLSDTDDTNITGSELITNGNFAANSDWTYQGGTTSFNISSGKLNYDGSGTIYLKAYQNITGLTVGQRYVLSINLTAISSHNISFAFATSNIGNTLLANTVSTTGTHNISYTATQANVSVYVQTNHATMTFSVDDFSLRIAEEDRSQKNTAIAAYGTIVKAPVATGAELVAYGPFNNSTFLRQPPNSSMNIGTGDAYEMIWYKTPTGSGTMMIMSYEGGANGTNDYGKPFNIRMEAGVVRGWASHNGFSTWDDVSHGISTADNHWHCAAWVKRGAVFELYVDGEFIGSDTGAVGSNAMSDANTELVLGARKRGKLPTQTHDEHFDGYLALARIGKTAPTAEQIKRIYNDEKYFFSENAKCTLYGTSDEVTALAYDDSTDVLHVGTSSGRSEFQGLNRINNTTTAVTTSISASNGLVAEQ